MSKQHSGLLDGAAESHADAVPAMRLCVISRSSDRSECALLKSLAARGHSVTFIAEATDPALGKIERAGVRVHTADMRHRFDRGSVRSLRAILRNQHFDLIYATGSRTLSNALLATRGSPVPFVTYRGTLSRVSYLNPVNRLVQLNRRVRRIIVNSAAVRKVLIDCGVQPHRIAVVHKGHALEWYANAHAIRREDSGIPANRFLVGCMANFRPEKGGRTLLEALARIPRELPIHLVLVGDIRDPQIERTVRRLDLQHRITIAGHRPNALDWIASFDVSVMPSKRESMSRSIVESIAIGIPVIVTRVGGMPELVLDGHTGIVVEPDNPAELAAAIVEAWRNPERMQAYAEAGRRHLAEHYSVEGYVREMEQALAAVLRAES